jgi:hypothetical protein
MHAPKADILTVEVAPEVAPAPVEAAPAPPPVVPPPEAAPTPVAAAPEPAAPAEAPASEKDLQVLLGYITLLYSLRVLCFYRLDIKSYSVGSARAGNFRERR